VSAATKSQVIAFIIAVVFCFGFLLAGFTPVTDFLSGWAPAALVDTISGFSFLTRFDSIAKGVIDLRDIIFFASLIALCLFINAAVLEARKA